MSEFAKLHSLNSWMRRGKLLRKSNVRSRCLPRNERSAHSVFCEVTSWGVYSAAPRCTAACGTLGPPAVFTGLLCVCVCFVFVRKRPPFPPASTWVPTLCRFSINPSWRFYSTSLPERRTHNAPLTSWYWLKDPFWSRLLEPRWEHNVKNNCIDALI